MKFSIIIPIYNVEPYLPKCLESLQQQSFQDFEVICVNDGSTDGSAAIAEAWVGTNPNARLIHQSNAGLSAARNAGLDVARGEYLLFLDSDDWLEPDALRILSENLSGEEMLCFNGRRYFEDKQQYESADPMEPERGATGWDYYCRHALDHRNFAFECVVLRCYRRDFLLGNNLRFKPGIFHEDDLFTPQACYYAQQVAVTPDVLYNYRVRSSSIMTTRSLKHRQDYIRIANDLAAFFRDKPIPKTTLYRSLTHHYQSAFVSNSPIDDKQLLPLVNWPLYRLVSRTKPRHRIQYAAMRLSPRVFRIINHNL